MGSPRECDICHETVEEGEPCENRNNHPGRKKNVRFQAMTCSEYLEHLWNEDTLHTLIDEQYNEGGVNTDKLFEFMVACAKADSVLLIDKAEWEYDRPLYTCYREAEKGLS